MIQNIEKFDGIITTNLSRIGRSVKQLDELARILKEKKKDLVVIKENIDTTTSSGMLFYHLLSAFNEYEASLIKERTIIGRQRAKDEGKHLGRNKIDTNDKELVKLYQDKMLGMDSIAKLKGISKSTIRRRLLDQHVEIRDL